MGTGHTVGKRPILRQESVKLTQSSGHRSGKRGTRQETLCIQLSLWQCVTFLWPRGKTLGLALKVPGFQSQLLGSWVKFLADIRASVSTFVQQAVALGHL